MYVQCHVHIRDYTVNTTYKTNQNYVNTLPTLLWVSFPNMIFVHIKSQCASFSCRSCYFACSDTCFGKAHGWWPMVYVTQNLYI